MSINVYEITKTDTVLFKRDSAVNDLFFDLVSTFKSEQATAKDRAETCYAIAHSPIFAAGGICEHDKPADIVAAQFGKLLSATSFRKYVSVCERFAHAEGEHASDLRVIYDTFQLGKLVQLSVLESPANREKGFHAYAFFVSQGKTVNDAASEKHAEWEKSNADTLDMISDLTAIGRTEAAEKLRATLTEEPEKPVSDDDYSTLFAMGIKIVKGISDKELTNRIAAYLPEKPTKQKQEQQKQKQEQEQEQPKTLAELKAAAAAALADYITAAEEQGETVQKSIKSAAEKLSAE